MTCTPTEAIREFLEGLGLDMLQRVVEAVELHGPGTLLEGTVLTYDHRRCMYEVWLIEPNEALQHSVWEFKTDALPVYREYAKLDTREPK